ncbi:MAG: 16S rRNA (cytidine(1402)-2'-O)-methyltransferase [Thermincola sp.]|nr:16S rRNA (cytidine(1402)-2'-O)-methyltransferase [Thermincola sp.]
MTKVNDDTARGILYVCATPIGNLEDITLRAKRILQEVDLIAAEDTRHTRKLLSFYDIHTPLTSYHEHNKWDKGPKLIGELSTGKNIALVSDAGTPGISDPGQDLVRLAAEAGIAVVPIPGASAVVSALVISGLPTDRFCFEGFLPRTKKERRTMIEQWVREQRTIVFYESPYRLVKTLEELSAQFGERNIAVTRELTKAHEEVVRGTLLEALRYFKENSPKGEIAVIIQGTNKNTEAPPQGPVDVSGYVSNLVLQGYNKKDAIKDAARLLGVSKREVYDTILKAEEKRPERT